MSEKASRSMKFAFVALTVLAVALLLSLFSGHVIHAFSESGPISGSNNQPDQLIPLECMPDQISCAAKFDGYRVHMRLSDPDFPALKPVKLEYIFDVGDFLDNHGGNAPEVRYVSSSIAGRDMFMGVHAVTLDEQSSNRVRLEGLVPVCVTGTDMVWRVSSKFLVNGKLIELYSDLRSLVEQ